MLPKLIAPETSRDHPEVVAKLQQMAATVSPTGLANTLRGLAARPDRTQDLEHIHVNTLIISSFEDAVIPFAESEAMAKRLPHATLVAIPNAGHLPPLENPAQTSSAIDQFLTSLTKA
jgi:3-oxoadipate enol-lactonase